MPRPKTSKIDASQASGTSPSVSVPVTRRGVRIELAAHYSGLGPFFLEEIIRNGTLPAVGGSGSGVCAAYIVLREHLDELLDVSRNSVARAEERRKERRVA